MFIQTGVLIGLFLISLRTVQSLIVNGLNDVVSKGRNFVKNCIEAFNFYYFQQKGHILMTFDTRNKGIRRKQNPSYQRMFISISKLTCPQLSAICPVPPTSCLNPKLLGQPLLVTPYTHVT